MSTSMHPGAFDTAEHALPPPAAAPARAHAVGADDARRRATLHLSAIGGAVAFALLAVAALNHAISIGGPDAPSPLIYVVGGLAAAAVSVLLGRVAYRNGPDAHDAPDADPTARG